MKSFCKYSPEKKQPINLASAVPVSTDMAAQPCEVREVAYHLSMRPDVEVEVLVTLAVASPLMVALRVPVVATSLCRSCESFRSRKSFHSC